MALKQHGHECSGVNAPQDGYGSAITSVEEREDGTLWAGNGEYGTQVNFCPFCGFEAEVKIRAGVSPIGATVPVRFKERGFYVRCTVVRHDEAGRHVVAYYEGENRIERVASAEEMR